MNSTGKRSLVELHITTNDLLKAHSYGQSRSRSYRDTWPTLSRETKPGTFAFDSIPTLTRTPWEWERSKRPASQWSRGSIDRKPTTCRIFAQLPVEILDCILGHLASSYFSSSPCNVQAFRSDLTSLCLTNRQLHNVAQDHLYREVWLPSHAFPKRKLLRFHRPTSRLEQLLRTLRENDHLADLVRCIRVGFSLANMLDTEITDPHHIPDHSSAMNTLCKIIQRCRKLEHFLGYAPNTVEHAAELYTSLDLCPNLKSHILRLSTDWQRSSSFNRPGPFVSSFANWTQLHTLVVVEHGLHCSLPPGTITSLLQKLPALQHLSLSRLSSSDFHNGTLLMLPPLKSLRLDTLHGITDQGLRLLADSRTALSLQNLSLCRLELTSLRTIHALLSEISNLRRFTLHQNTSPELSQMETVATTNVTLSSASLEYLHWDILAPGHGRTLLANSIASGRFPNLRTVRVPCDFDGAIQSLCRPIAYQPLTAEDMQTLEIFESQWAYSRSLLASQIKAQIRIRQSRQEPSINVVVQDEDSTVQHEHFIGSYLGNIASPITYTLDPAIGGTSAALADMQLATYPGPYLTSFPGYWTGCNDNPDGTKEFRLDLEMLF